MLNFPLWKKLTILLVVIFSIFGTIVNFLPKSMVAAVQAYLPVQTLNLGLDLQGGSHLLMQVDTDAVLQARLEESQDGVRDLFRGEKIGYRNLTINGDALQVGLRDQAQHDQAYELLRKLDNEMVVTEENGQFQLRLRELARQQMNDRALDQSIEIVRRRVDETGTKEPLIQRQGTDRILLQLPGIEEPERVKSLIGQTAKLNFHLLDVTHSLAEAQQGRVPPGTFVLPDAALDAKGQPRNYYLVQRRVVVSGEHLVDAQPSFQDNQPVVSFRFDPIGGRQFGAATAENVEQFLAIVLDGKVISAPQIRQPILGGSGIITGNFTVQQADDLALLLRAGALPAPLHFIEERTVGPGLGSDSVEAGKIASILAIVFVMGFMILAYGLFGWMANAALMVNITLIIAVLSLVQATLTLPGIAGIVLTVGMAVDANVLIFERIKEEVRLGRTTISAIESGFKLAFGTILDSNLTTLIATALLFAFGTGPIKGFAVTLSVGILTSMFTAIMVTRLMIVTWLRHSKTRKLP